MNRKLKNARHGTKNLWKEAKTRVRVFANRRNFAMCARCINGIPVSLVFCGVPKKGDKIRNGYITPAFSVATSGRNCYATPAFLGVPGKGDKIGSGYITPTVLGSQ